MSEPTQTPATESPAQSREGEQFANPFHNMVGQLRKALLDAGPVAPNAADPASDQPFGRHIDAHLVAQQGLIIQRCEMLARDDYENYRAVTIMQRSLALIEKTRTRILKSREFATRIELEKLKALDSSSQPDRAEARNFLQKELAGGERPAKEILAIAQSLGLSDRTIYRAKNELNITSIQRDRTWHWSLPTLTTECAAVSSDSPNLDCTAPIAPIGPITSGST